MDSNYLQREMGRSSMNRRKRLSKYETDNYNYRCWAWGYAWISRLGQGVRNACTERTIFTGDGGGMRELKGGYPISEVLDDPVNFFLELSSDEVTILFGVSYSSSTTPHGQTYD